MHIWDSSTGLCMGSGTQVTVKACCSLDSFKKIDTIQCRKVRNCLDKNEVDV